MPFSAHLQADRIFLAYPGITWSVISSKLLYFREVFIRTVLVMLSNVLAVKRIVREK
jgi:hypothetical protein